MITIHTYGDSHASNYGGWGDIKNENIKINVNHIEGKLAFSFGRDKMQVVNNVNSGDVVIFCFGEIDCRCHINKYEPNWKESIDTLVQSYVENIHRNVMGIDGLRTCVYNVVPPLERENPLNLWTEVWAVENGVPATGTDEDRKKYTEYMNSKLKEYCEKYSYLFFDVYEKYSDENGFLKRELSDTNCHIKNPIYIEEFILKNIENE
jgi:hypothetical protein